MGARRAAGGTIRSARARPSSGAATRWASWRRRLGAAAAAPAGSGVAPAASADAGRARSRWPLRPGRVSARVASGVPAVGSRGGLELARETRVGHPRSWSSAQTNAIANPTATTAMAGSDLRVGPIPSQSTICGLSGISTTRTTYMFANRPEAQDGVRDDPPPGDRREDDPDREERVDVALVDAGRQHEERQRQDRERDEQRQPVGPSPGHHEHRRDPGEQQRRPDEDRRDGAEDGRPGPASIGVEREVADPQAAVREAVAGVAGHERPRVEGVDREVGVGAAGGQELLEEPDSACSPKGSASRTAVPSPTSPVVRIRIGRPVAGLVAEAALRPERAGGWSRSRPAGRGCPAAA